MRSFSWLLLGAAAACSATNREPSLLAIEPSTVSTLVPTPAVLAGENLYARPTIALDHPSSSALDTGWTVSIDDASIAAAWASADEIDLTIPPGLVLGEHDIAATSPDGEVVALPAAFVVTGAPITGGADAFALSIAVPATIGAGETFAVTATVTNTDADAVTATPSALVASGSGSGSATLVQGPTPASAAIAAGASATFSWTFTATAVGVIRFVGGATGVDGNGPSLAATAVSNSATIAEALAIAPDPFGDGSPFAFATGYAGEVYVGPNATGGEAARFAPDGSDGSNGSDGSVPELLAFALPADIVGTQTANHQPPMYPSLGADGCMQNTYACGPNNENGRGVLADVQFAGGDWLVAGGAHVGTNNNYLYATSSTSSPLAFSYIDLTAFMGGGTLAWSALAGDGTRMYAGALANGGQRPRLLAIATAPPSPGLDPAAGDVIDLHAEKMPGMQDSGTSMIDTIATVGGDIYIANSGAWWRSTVASPADYVTAPSDWTAMTPSSLAYTLLASYATSKMADLEPADRAVPQIASFGGHVFAGRNTVSGPQLWRCDPSSTGDAAQCDPADWSLVAANTTGNRALTQFNNTALVAIAMVVATPQFLYIGFDGTTGAAVYRTANPAAAAASDFAGALGCSAATGASCEGYGGNGLGAITNTNILDGKALTFGATTDVWITVGDDSDALSLVMLP
ncbi:MAG TPA: hypothetical protein VGG74_27080 [Kofleriaceae bacterium]